MVLLRSISAVQFDRHPPFHSRPRSSRRRSWHPHVWDGLMQSASRTAQLPA
jgi:hypothetical protein